jgi:hypothetical protein
MHFCTAKINLSGDLRNVVYRDHFEPISWPEVDVLRFLHGDDAINDVKAFVRVEQSPKDEKERLRLKYGNDVVEQVYPGRNPQMQMEAAGTKLPDTTPKWLNPLDNEPAGYDVPPEARAEKARTFSAQK